jgi:acetyl-CoA synthetase
MSSDFHRIRTQAEYDSAHAASVKDPEAFWAAQAERFTWHKPWNKVLEWDFEKPEVKWFIGGKLNITPMAMSEQERMAVLPRWTGCERF